jgi:ligand-binding sensor domain-containing protein
LALYEDADRNLWVGTDGGGLNKFNRNTEYCNPLQTRVNQRIASAGNYVLTVNQDYEGDFWIGTWADGLSIFNPKTNVFTTLKNNPNDPNSLGWQQYIRAYTLKRSHYLDRYLQ